MGLSIGISTGIPFQVGANLNQPAEYPEVIEDGNTVAWYDYTQASTLTADGSNFVSAWNSRIGSNHLLQTSGTNQPLLTADGVLFDGVDNFMKAVAFTFNRPSFIYIVFKQVTWTSSDVILDGNSTDAGNLFQRTASPRLAAFAGLRIEETGDLAVNTFGIVRMLFDGANSKMIVNNKTPVTGNTGTNNMGGITLGSIGSTLARYSNISVKDILLRKVADNETDETNIYNYLKTKYSL